MSHEIAEKTGQSGGGHGVVDLALSRTIRGPFACAVILPKLALVIFRAAEPAAGAANITILKASKFESTKPRRGTPRLFSGKPVRAQWNCLPVRLS